MINYLLVNFYLLVLIFILFFILIYFPGKYLCSKVLLINNDILISSSVGYTVFVFVGFIVYYFKFSIFFFLLIYLIFFFFIFKQKFLVYKIDLKNFIIVVKKNKLELFCLLIVFVQVLFLSFTVNFQSHGADQWSITSFVRSIIDDQYISNNTSFYGLTQSAYPSNSFVLFASVVKKLNMNISIVHIWNSFSAFFIIIFLLMLFNVTQYFTKSLKLTYISILFLFTIFLYFPQSFYNLFYQYSAYPKLFSAFIFLPIIIYIFFSNHLNNRRVSIFLVFYFIAIANQSILNLILLGILTISFIILKFLEKKNYFFLFGVYILSVLFVYVIFKDFYYSPSGVISTYTTKLEQNSILKKFFNFIYIYDPIKFYENYLINYVILIILGIFAYSIKKKYKTNHQDFFRYFFIIYIISLLIIFNPLAIYILNLIIPIYFLERINYILLSPLIFLILFSVLIKRKYFKYLLIITIILNLHYLFKNYKLDNYSDHLFFEKFLNDKIEVNNFIITDKYTALKLLSFKKSKILITNEDFLKVATPPEFFEYYEKIYSYSGEIITQNLYENLKKIKGDYLIVNRQTTKNFSESNTVFNKRSLVFQNKNYLIYDIKNY